MAGFRDSNHPDGFQKRVNPNLLFVMKVHVQLKFSQLKFCDDCSKVRWGGHDRNASLLPPRSPTLGSLFSTMMRLLRHHRPVAERL